MQQSIIDTLSTLDSDHLYLDREKFLDDVEGAMKKADIKFKANIKKAIWKAIGEQGVNKIHVVFNQLFLVINCITG